MPVVKDLFVRQPSILKSSDYKIDLKDIKLFKTKNKYCEVIENADGVPFQLIFGPGIGEGFFLQMGQGIKNLTGIEPWEMTEKTFQNIRDEIIPLCENIPADPVEARKKFIAGEIEKYKAEILITTRKGEKKWISETYLPLKDDETAKVIGAIGVLFDINERKQVLEYMAQADEKANESDRLKASFLQNISHEVRTPLNAIVGFSTLICEPENGNYQKQEFLDLINNNTDLFLAVMDNILEISRIEANSVNLNLREVNLSIALQSIYNRFREQADAKMISFNYRIPGNEDIFINTDGYKFLQVMTNLLNNALKFTFRGSIEFGYRMIEDFVEFYVTDTGIGIPEEHKQRIFNKFYQVESGMTRRFSGIGLGLSISKAYVEMLGGSISFTSELGKGTTFRFTIPR